eukprot:SAG22_NODE_4423_length_1273_cov_1.853492_3_plen_83_part_01
MISFPSENVPRSAVSWTLRTGEALATVAKLLKLVNAFYHFIYYRIQRRAPEHESDTWELQPTERYGVTADAAAAAASGPPPSS